MWYFITDDLHFHETEINPLISVSKEKSTITFAQGCTIEAERGIYASVNKPSLVQIMACRLDGAKPLSVPMLEYC